MKATRIVSLALITFAAAGFNAHAESADNYPQPVQKFVSTLTRAQVQADAIKATRESFHRTSNNESGEYLFSAPVAAPSVVLTREAVRAEAFKARGIVFLQDYAG